MILLIRFFGRFPFVGNGFKPFPTKGTWLSGGSVDFCFQDTHAGVPLQQKPTTFGAPTIHNAEIPLPRKTIYGNQCSNNQKERAEKEGIPVFIIANNNQLIEIIKKKPKTLETLHQIQGTLHVKIDDSKTFRKESSIYEVQHRVSEQFIKESIAT